MSLIPFSELNQWVGRTESAGDVIGATPARGLQSTLDIDLNAPIHELPALWHWLYFLPRTPQSEIGLDGHPRLGGFLPPIPLPRRMWASGTVRRMRPVALEADVVRTSRITAITPKSGRSGHLVFVTLNHELADNSGVLLSEDQHLVYRAEAQPSDVPAPPQAPPAEAGWSREFVPDPVLLFRYSALTFNAHRIHYDRDYAMHTEGYPGLVVHGPLLATLLADLVRRERPEARISVFSFKAVRPVFDLYPFRLCGRPSDDGRGADLWVEDHEGWLAMQATVQFE